MSVHEQFADDLPRYALGELDGDARLGVEKHLSECSDCRRELEQLRGDLSLLALSATGAQPPARSRQKLIAAIAEEPRRARIVPAQPRTGWWSGLGWAFAFAAIVIAALLRRQNSDLRETIASLEVRYTHQQAAMTEAKALMASLTSTEAEHFILVASKAPPQPQGKAMYMRKSGMLVFMASNMPQLPPHKMYELWLIPPMEPPVPAGMFKPGPDGSAMVIKPPLTPGMEAKTFAITVEPEGGSAAPTSQPIMISQNQPEPNVAPRDHDRSLETCGPKR
jgi:anti-sigma-K factor RskA